MAEGTAGAVETGQGGAASGASSTQTSTTTSSSAASTGAASSAASQPKWEETPQYKGLIGEVQKERKQRQDFERKFTEFQTQLAERERQIQALTGSRTPTKEEADAEAIRARLQELSPAARLTEEQLDKLMSLVDRGDELEETVNQHWFRHSRSMLDALDKEVSAELGDLTDRQKKKMYAAYVQNAESDPEFHRRHDAGDPNLIKQFAKEWIEDFIEPARRKNVATEVGRYRPVPNGRDQTIPMNGDKPIDYKDDKAVMDFIMKNRAGKFGR